MPINYQAIVEEMGRHLTNVVEAITSPPESHHLAGHDQACRDLLQVWQEVVASHTTNTATPPIVDVTPRFKEAWRPEPGTMMAQAWEDSVRAPGGAA